MTTTFLRGLLLTLFLGLTWHAQAQSERPQAPPTFVNAAEEKRFHALVAELRCVMCQNQSLADSDAQIAKDLRREVLDLIREGRSDGEIRDYLVARYGEFVLYRPRMSGATWLLWFGPLAFVFVGTVVALRLGRGARAGRGAAAAPAAAHPGAPAPGAAEPKTAASKTAVPEDDSQEW